MRYFPVILILVLGLVSSSVGEELFLVTVVSVDRDRGTVHVQVADTAGSIDKTVAETSSREAAIPFSQAPETGTPELIEISDQTLADSVQPGQIVRIWGDIVQTSSGMRLTPMSNLLPGVGMGGSDPSGVRRRLKKSMGMSRGGMGMSRGKP